MDSKISMFLFRVFTMAVGLASLAVMIRGLYLGDASAAFGLVLLITAGILSVPAYVGVGSTLKATGIRPATEFGDWAEELKSGTSNVKCAS